MKKFNLILAIITISVTAFHCSKNKSIEQNPSADMLSAKTWVFDVVTEYEPGYPPEVLYNKSASVNLIDLSKVEHQFLPGGIYKYKDEMGISGDGTWKLLANGTKLELKQNSTGDIEEFTDLTVSASSLSFKQSDDQNYSILKCVPKP